MFSMERIKGQAMPEMLIVFPLAVILVMSIIQFGLLYRAKATLNNATFLAARAGSLDHGYTTKMTSVFLEKMSALVKVPDTTASRTVSAAYVANPDALRLAALEALVKNTTLYPVVEIIFPTKAVFNEFAVSFKNLQSCSGSTCPGGGKLKLGSSSIMEIPNNNLDARIQTPQSIGGHQVSLDDANLLSIRTRFCYSLEVPVANFVIWRAMQLYQSTDKDWRYCQAQVNSRFSIPIVGHSIVRMQSGFRCQGDEHAGSACSNI
jgi:Flp pilus assembly protein TadG